MKLTHLSLFLILIAQSSLAAVKLDMTLKINNQLVSQPIILTEFEKVATITQESSDSKEGIEITVTAHRVEKKDPQATDAVKLDIIISRIKGDIKTVLSKPQIITLIGKEARVTQTNGDGSNLEFTVVPTLIQFTDEYLASAQSSPASLKFKQRFH